MNINNKNNFKNKKQNSSSNNNSTPDQRRQVAGENNELKESKHGYFETEGKVVKVECGRFKVQVTIGSKEIIVDAYTSGHLKMNKIRIIQGDIVTILIPPIFDPEVGPKGRITHRKDVKNFNQ